MSGYTDPVLDYDIRKIASWPPGSPEAVLVYAAIKLHLKRCEESPHPIRKIPAG